MGKYITIQLPEEFVKQMIDSLVDKEELGYTSRSEVVKDAVRTHYMDYIKNLGDCMYIEEFKKKAIKNRKLGILVILAKYDESGTFISRNVFPNEELMKQDNYNSLLKKIYGNASKSNIDKIFFEQNQGICGYSIKFYVANPKKKDDKQIIMLSVLFPEQKLDKLEDKIKENVEELSLVIKENSWSYDAIMGESVKFEVEGEELDRIGYWVRGLYLELI